MKAKILLLLIILPFLIKAQYSQTKKIKATLEVSNLNPNYISLIVPFVSIKSVTYNTNGYLDGGIDGKFGKILFNARCNFSFADELNTFPYHYRSVYSEENSRNINLNIGYVIKRKELERTVYFDLKTEGNINYVASGTVPITKFKAINLGVENGFTFYGGTGSSFKYSKPNNVPLDFIPNSSNTATYLTYNTISVGYKRGFYGYWKVKFDGYGYREAQVMSFWYFNALYLTNAQLDDVVLYQRDNYDKYTYQRVSLKNTKLSRFGICGGFQRQDINKFGIGLKIEIGMYPGVSSSLLTRIGLNLSTNISLSKLFK